jgi:hypothetical protein
MLLKQDKVTLLEARLEELDRDERRVLFLQSSRDDKNSERAAVMADYGNGHHRYGPFSLT